MRKREMVLLLIMVLSAGTALSQSLDKTRIAAEAADRWLGYIDSDDYAKSWDTAATLFQKAISRENWIKQLNEIRTPLGIVQSRDEVSATFSTQLPGVPDGEYVIVRYQTRFEKKRAAVETLTLAYDRDKWRVAGYFIK